MVKWYDQTMEKIKQRMEKGKEKEKAEKEDTILLDRLIWSTDLRKHAFGVFSFAGIQGKALREEEAQVDIHESVTFAAIFDGHGGDQAADLLAKSFLRELVALASQNSGRIVSSMITRVLLDLESKFMRMAAEDTKLHKTGSSCLVVAITKEDFIVANIGSSCAVIGREEKDSKDLLQKTRELLSFQHKPRKLLAIPITVEHSLQLEGERKRMLEDPENAPFIFLDDDDDTWKLRDQEGSRLSRSFGDLHLKFPEFAEESMRSLHFPVIRSDPDETQVVLKPENKFIILASDGFWRYFSPQEAVDLVGKHPNEGIAKRLVRKAVKLGIKEFNEWEKEGGYKGLYFRKHGSRYDDISVIVIFLDNKLMQVGQGVPMISSLSFKHPEVSELKGLRVPSPSTHGATTSGTN